MRKLAAYILLVLFARTTMQGTDKPFVTLTSVTVAGSFFDARASIIRPERREALVCGREGNAWLYGRYPTPARTYGQMLGTTAIMIGASYVLRKRHSRFWSVPMLWDAGNHWWGAAEHYTTCP